MSPTWTQHDNTADGRNPAPVDMKNFSVFAGVFYIPGGFLAGFLNHQ